MAIISAILCLPLGEKAARRVTLACHSSLLFLVLILLRYTLNLDAGFAFTMGHYEAPFGNEIFIGSREVLLALLFIVVSLLAILGGREDLYRDLPRERLGFYYLTQNLMTGSLLAIIYSNDIFTSFVFIDIVAIAACILVVIKPGGRNLAAATTYLIMSLIGSSLLLFAIAILYGITGHLLLPQLQESILSLVATGEYTLPLFVLAALLTTGLAIKSALFPFHSWLPNVYTSATTSAVTVLSGLISKSYLILLIAFSSRLFTPEVLELLGLPDLLLLLGLGGILFGSLRAMKTPDLKSMLAYASISQIGFIVAAMALNNADGFAAALFHILVHALTKAMLFVAAGGLAAVSDQQTSLSSLRGAAYRDPISGGAFLLGSLSLIGIPPFPGFFSKLYATQAALNSPRGLLFIIVAIGGGTILSAIYYLPAVFSLFAPVAEEGACRRALSPWRSTALYAFMALILIVSLLAGSVRGILG